jgi:NDP-sugar pyrophosphorylase family protein
MSGDCHLKDRAAALQVGVKNIVLAVNYRADVMEKFLKEYEEKV